MKQDPFDITGKTRLYAILADPIEQVKTPQKLNRLMRDRGTDGVMVPVHVGPEGLEQMLAGLRAVGNFGGLVATVPHKKAILAFCDTVSDRARAIGAANVVRREKDGTLSADMLDGEGFIQGLRSGMLDPKDKSVYLAGAGGAALAIAFALAKAGIARLTIYNRTASTAEKLREQLVEWQPALSVRVGSADPSGHDLAVNATSLGMRPDDPLPFDTSKLQAGMTVAEIIMEPEMTPLLTAAEAAGCTIQHGAPMLNCQIELMAEFLGMTS